eukprot:2087412-Amphidinium_carterae.1
MATVVLSMVVERGRLRALSQFLTQLIRTTAQAKQESSRGWGWQVLWRVPWPSVGSWMDPRARKARRAASARTLCQCHWPNTSIGLPQSCPERGSSLAQHSFCPCASTGSSSCPIAFCVSVCRELSERPHVCTSANLYENEYTSKIIQQHSPNDLWAASSSAQQLWSIKPKELGKESKLSLPPACTSQIWQR